MARRTSAMDDAALHMGAMASGRIEPAQTAAMRQIRRVFLMQVPAPCPNVSAGMSGISLTRPDAGRYFNRIFANGRNT